MNSEIEAVYGHKIRVRACGLCWKGDRLLMVNHKGLADGGLWAPPGGGLEFGETAEERLKKEFLEETGLHVSVDAFQFACEFISGPLHAIELFFRVTITGGTLQKGHDPELDIIDDVRFMSPSELAVIPASRVHGILLRVTSADELKTLNGFFRI